MWLALSLIVLCLAIYRLSLGGESPVIAMLMVAGAYVLYSCGVGGVQAAFALTDDHWAKGSHPGKVREDIGRTDTSRRENREVLLIFLGLFFGIYAQAQLAVGDGLASAPLLAALYALAGVGGAVFAILRQTPMRALHQSYMDIR